MKKTSLILVLCIVLITGCSVKEGFTTFGALQNKIDDYLINVDISDAVLSEAEIDSVNYGKGVLKAYQRDEQIVYIKAELELDKYMYNYEVFYIDDSLTYIIEISSEYDKTSDKSEGQLVRDDLKEYIILEGKTAVFNIEEAVLEDMDTENKLTKLIELLENSIN